jgi:carboxyl-terminal processing protease
MRFLERAGRLVVLFGAFALASYLALRFGTGGLWQGLRAAHAVVTTGKTEAPYDLTQLVAVNETLETIRKKYVEPERVEPRKMLLGALDQVQKEVAQVIVLHAEKSPTVMVRVGQEQAEFRVDNVQGPWDVAARLREVFAFLQKNLSGTEVELQAIEYAACNGMLRTLDPHSVFLSPEMYREMNMSTSGHFGGLGIVISIRDQVLTVMRPMPDTPAGRSGLRRLDRITKINNESTLNMPLDDAVKRLRGEPGSKVTIWVHRDGNDGWPGSRPFELVREEIRIRSVESQKLGDGVGYVRLKQFQSSTAAELGQALTDLRQAGSLKSLVLDLRDNPGGLLDQAAKVADLFLSDGVIVATAGASEGREEQRAREPGTQPDYPIAVLVNGSSASASEIVAGALKNQDRAVVIGQTTFGKGSVQLVFPNITPEGAALKLTIAQYLTPGDVSIQGVGVAPDIELDPMTADTLEMDLFKNEGDLRERDLSRSLTAQAARSQDRPMYRLRYNLPSKERDEIRERGADLEDEFRLDVPIRMARDLMAQVQKGPRSKQLEAIKDAVGKLEQKELSAVSGDLAKLGVDWAAPPSDYAGGPDPAKVKIEVTTDRAKDLVRAGESMTLKVTAKNEGDKPLYQLRAITKSDAAYYDEKELVFGKLMPGESRTATAPLGFCTIEGRKPGSTEPLPLDAKRVCEMPKDAVMRQDAVKVKFFAEGADAPESAEFRPTVESLDRPTFAYSYQVVDNRDANGNGQLERGEGASVYMRIKNVGTGTSYETQANLRNLTGDGLLLRAGRFDVSRMKPGDTRDVTFSFDVLDSFTEPEVKLELSVVDRDLRVVSSEKLVLPVVKKGIALRAGEGAVELTKAAPLRDQPVAGSLVVGRVPQGKLLKRLGSYGDFVKVDLGQTRFAFVEASATRSAQAQAPALAEFDQEPRRSPPVLDVKPASLATRDAKVHVQGRATDTDGGVLDAFIFVGSRKVFYKSNKGASDKSALEFSLDAELTPGVNVITVVARESEDTASRYTMIVRRDGPNGEALPTPKAELFGEDWQFTGDDQ